MERQLLPGGDLARDDPGRLLATVLDKRPFDNGHRFPIAFYCMHGAKSTSSDERGESLPLSLRYHCPFVTIVGTTVGCTVGYHCRVTTVGYHCQIPLYLTTDRSRLLRIKNVMVTRTHVGGSKHSHSLRNQVADPNYVGVPNPPRG